MSKNEIVGRLRLWSGAIYETQRFVKLALRADNAFHSRELIDANEQRIKKMHEFSKRQPDYKEGVLLDSHAEMFDRIHPEPFPSRIECSHLKESNTISAVIMFCQIYVSGYQHDGVAFNNSKAFRDKHLEAILNEVFPINEDRKKYDDFANTLLSARNQMLGHADANSFNIKHGAIVSSLKLPSAAIKELDLHYWNDFLEPLHQAILKYSGKM
ncbi:TPA: hypothetical protein NGU10_001466 [Vibrio parahaemolyticus]|nr:hypothetical protein [Vibrio parahaemolyticus]HCE2486487.1 hypothetical protein [Vibrio parahaemolyticus]